MKKHTVRSLIRGHSKKSVSKTKAPREVGFFALCSGGKNMKPHSARKNSIFLPFLQWFFWEKNFKSDLKNFWPNNQIVNDQKYQ